jgi:hypothetical protein
MPVVTFVASVAAALFVLACAAILGGCGAAQRTVSAVAVAAVVADDANATAYELQAREAIARVEAHGGDFTDWCSIMAEPWERSSQAECAISALASLALAGQHVIDAGGDLDAEWAGAACATLAAVESAWNAAEEPPAVLAQARALVCALADGARAGPPVCAPAGTPPPCPNGKCYTAKQSRTRLLRCGPYCGEVTP